MAKTNVSASASNAATVDPTAAAMSEFEKQIMAQLEGWEEVETGFPPYWKPAVGKILMGKVCVVDFRDPSFPRVVLQATKVAIPCQRGPVDGAEDVTVKPGEFFTMSEYAALNLSAYIDLEVAIKCVGERDVPADKARNLPKRDMFEWKVWATPEGAKLLKARSVEEMKLLKARRTLGEGEIVPTSQATA
jgi:hypothetical protein